jgi:uncharacterized protein YcfL
MRIRTAIGFIAFLALVACQSDITAPNMAQDNAVMAASTTVTNDSHWETWHIGTFFLCDGSRVDDGYYDVHLQSTYRERADGSVNVSYHVNSARARGTSDTGVEYVLQQVGRGTQEYILGGATITVETQNFRLLSPGPAANLLLTYKLTISVGVGSPPVVNFDLIRNECRG